MSAQSDSVFKMEVQGRVSSLVGSHSSRSMLVTTMLNGCHTFRFKNSDDGSTFNGFSESQIETFPAETVGSQPFLCSCLSEDGSRIFLGSSTGEVTAIIRSNPAGIGCAGRSGVYKHEEPLPVRSLHAFPSTDLSVLLCTDSGTAVIDVEAGERTWSCANIAPRGIGAVPLGEKAIAVANYDGKVLLFDTRCSSTQPYCILSVPDQITAVAVGENSAVYAGTVGGRVFRLRCIDTQPPIRDEALATGLTRSPLRSLAVQGDVVAAGDVSGKLAIIDCSEKPNPTVYWRADQLFESTSAVSEAEAEGAVDVNALQNWNNSEVTATCIQGGLIWASFCAHGSEHSDIIGIPL